MESDGIRMAIEKSRSIVYLAAYFAVSRIRLADIALQHDMMGFAAKTMAEARRFIPREPYAPHNPEIIEAWRQAVVEYNDRMATYQNHGIQLEPIDNPYGEKPYRECLREDLEKLLSCLPSDLR